MIIIVFKVDLRLPVKTSKCPLEGYPAVVGAAVVCCGFYFYFCLCCYDELRPNFLA